MSKSTKSRPAKTPVVNTDSLTLAARRAIRAICKSGCTKASSDSGFAKITGKYPHRRGYQLFVVAEPWSDEAMIEFPESGGLESRAMDIAQEWNRNRFLKHLANRVKRGEKGGAK